MAAAYPARAAADKIGGAVVLDCTFTTAGGLTQCGTVSEEPRGRGFATAPRGLVPKFGAPAVDSSGVAIAGAKTQLPFIFAPSILENASPLILRPPWTTTPQLSDFADLLPEAAAKAGQPKARVVMACTVSATGSLEDCRVESEDPAGLGYGAATLRLSEVFKVSLWPTDGSPTIGSTVRVPRRYDFSDKAAATKD